MKRLLTIQEFDSLDFNDFLLRPIKELELSARTTNALVADDVYLIGHLLQKTEWDILKTPNLGSKSFHEIIDVLTWKGLRLRTAKEKVCYQRWAADLKGAL